MNAYSAYEVYQALKLHFTSSYDFFKYRGKIKTRCPDNKIVIYAALGKIEDKVPLKDVLVANYIATNTWPMAHEIAWNEGKIKALKVYNEWLRKMTSLPKVIKDEFRPLIDQHLLIIKPNEHPPLFRALKSNQISLETFICIVTHDQKVRDHVKTWDKNDPAISALFHQCKKYSPFVLTYCKDITKKVIADLEPEWLSD